jgi:hypothetical protein
MNYELAKKLKDAGFPIQEWIQHKDGSRQPYLPTLSELIEACSEFSSLTKSPRNTWYTAKQQGYPNNTYELVVGDEYPTPEEAVANLWLALNSKSK